MIDAIETRYAGHRFRSRLEARWAVFFDSLRLAWEYEPQGYRVGTRRRPYLPDFYLTDLRVWVEVKGASERLDLDLLRDAVDPAHGLGRADAHHRTTVLVLGDIPRPGVAHAHFTVSRSRAIGTPHAGAPTAPGAGCGGDCLFTGVLYGLAYFAPTADFMPPHVETDDLPEADARHLRRIGALLLPAARSTATVPRCALNQPVPIPRRGIVPSLDRAGEVARRARFEHGEAPW